MLYHAFSESARTSIYLIVNILNLLFQKKEIIDLFANVLLYFFGKRSPILLFHNL